MAVWHCYAVEVRWLQDLTDTPQYMLIVGVTWVVVTGLAMAGLLRLWGTGGALLAVGVGIAVLVAWDRLFEQPKRDARRAAIGEAQQSPGTQGLQSREGGPCAALGGLAPPPARLCRAALPRDGGGAGHLGHRACLERPDR